MNPLEIIRERRQELWDEAMAASTRSHNLREWDLPLRASAILTGAEYYLKYGPRLLKEYSSVRNYFESAESFAARDARGEFETCGHCHTTNQQKGLKWGKCDACGVMGVYPTEKTCRAAESR